MPLIRFFQNLSALHQYSLQLGHAVQGVACQHCQSEHDWVSHGFVYKKDYGGRQQKTGKRVLCSNRGKRKGCGRTVRLYLAERHPKLHYTLTAIALFWRGLGTLSIAQAYCAATGSHSDRNAYRWLSKMRQCTARHRRHLASPVSAEPRSTTIHPTLHTVLLETYSLLSAAMGTVEQYHLTTQQALFV